MTQEIKHSPLPWELAKDKRYTDAPSVHIQTSEGYAIADMAMDYSSIESIDEHIANAELIIRACNNHYIAKDALESFLGIYEYLKGDVPVAFRAAKHKAEWALKYMNGLEIPEKALKAAKG